MSTLASSVSLQVEALTNSETSNTLQERRRKARIVLRCILNALGNLQPEVMHRELESFADGHFDHLDFRFFSVLNEFLRSGVLSEHLRNKSVIPFPDFDIPSNEFARLRDDPSFMTDGENLEEYVIVNTDSPRANSPRAISIEKWASDMIETISKIQIQGIL